MSVIYKVYGTEGCPNCVLAKNLLGRNGLEFEYASAEENFNSFMEYLSSHAPKGARGFPQVFLEDGDEVVYIGGFKELNETLK